MAAATTASATGGSTESPLQPSKPQQQQQQQPQPATLRSPGGGDEGVVTEADLLEYTRSIDKLNSSLNFLQTEMQRLAQQQEVIMQMREQQQHPHWVISHSPQRLARTASTIATRSSG